MLHMAFRTLSGRRDGLDGDSSPPWLLTGLTSTCTSSPSSVLIDLRSHWHIHIQYVDLHVCRICTLDIGTARLCDPLLVIE